MEVDDGSCRWEGRGCTDPEAYNYLLQATASDGTCQFGGCMDSNSQAYDSRATFNDGSCTNRRMLQTAKVKPHALSARTLLEVGLNLIAFVRGLQCTTDDKTGC